VSCAQPIHKRLSSGDVFLSYQCLRASKTLQSFLGTLSRTDSPHDRSIDRPSLQLGSRPRQPRERSQLDPQSRPPASQGCAETNRCLPRTRYLTPRLRRTRHLHRSQGRLRLVRESGFGHRHLSSSRWFLVRSLLSRHGRCRLRSSGARGINPPTPSVYSCRPCRSGQTSPNSSSYSIATTP
jgi:hypothetical protein